MDKKNLIKKDLFNSPSSSVSTTSGKGDKANYTAIKIEGKKCIYCGSKNILYYMYELAPASNVYFCQDCHTPFSPSQKKECFLLPILKKAVLFLGGIFFIIITIMQILPRDNAFRMKLADLIFGNFINLLYKDLNPVRLFIISLFSLLFLCVPIAIFKNENNLK